MKRFLTAFFALLPSKLAHLFLKMIGHKISWSAKIGLSFIYVDELTLQEGSKIGHFNFLKVDSITLSKKALIRNLNYFKGPIRVFLGEKSIIGRLNKFTRAYSPVTYGESSLRLGTGTGITYGNFFDLTCSVTFGDHNQVAGKGGQFWTHGYIHAKEGVERIRIDGEISIGNNVYIGTRCTFNPGISVSNSINIGGNSVISKSLTKSGMYVNQPLRFVESDIENVRTKYVKIEDKALAEEVYTKNRKEHD